MLSGRNNKLSLAHSMATLTAIISFKTTPQQSQILSNPAPKGTKTLSLLQDLIARPGILNIPRTRCTCKCLIRETNAIMELGQSCLNLTSTLLPKGAAQKKKFHFLKLKRGRAGQKRDFKNESGVRYQREPGLYSGG